MRTTVRSLASLLLIFSAVYAPTGLAADQVIPTTPNPERCLKVGIYNDFGPTVGNIMIPILKRMYSLANLCMIPVGLPSMRSRRQLASGHLDAEMVRAPAGIEGMNGQAILVPQPIFRVSVLFTWRQSLEFDGSFKSLKGRAVGVLSGQRAARALVQRYTNNVTPLYNMKSAAKLLARRRIDVLISDGVGQAKFRRNFEKEHELLRFKVISNALVHHVLHVRHADKAEHLASALKSMIKNGELANLDAEHGLFPAEILP